MTLEALPIEPIYVIEQDDLIAEKLRECLARFGLNAGVSVVSNRDAAGDMIDDSRILQFEKPFRLGELLDYIARLQMNVAHHDVVVKIGAALLDVAHGLFYTSELAKPVRLTEKEVALLVLLAAERGKPLAREDLLSQVWQYAETAETHTLETHIYRLRQKIEKNPAKPVVLQTCEQGYFLSFEDI